MSDIPTRSRELVKARAHFRCERCMGAGAHMHHRRRRRIEDEHQHHPCNLVLLCGSCHRDVHAHPDRAVDTGFIVSAFVATPGLVPVDTTQGLFSLTCEGSYTTPNGDSNAHES